MLNTARLTWTDQAARRVLHSLFDAAVDAANPAHVLAGFLPEKPKGRCVVVGAGKAAASMAAAVEAAWPDVDVSGVVAAPDGYGMATECVVSIEASHPVPDERSEKAARAVLAAVEGLTADDLVLVLISGGGSSVLALPVEGITLADKRLVNKLLLASGLDIRTMNVVRRRLSAIKGGKLAAAAAPARVVTLAISDIPGDDVASIASGPSIPDDSTGRDLGEIVAQLGSGLPENVARRLLAPAPSPPVTPPADVRLISTPGGALEAAAAVARGEGLEVVILGDDLEGESREVGAWMAGRVREGGRRATVFLSGGETTVTLAGRSAGKGGRNTEFLLAMLVALDGDARVWGLSADTDGEDGASGGAAGAICGPDSLARATAAGLDPRTFLDGHDSATFFGALDDLIVTGPTRTNVNDFRAVLVLPNGVE